MEATQKRLEELREELAQGRIQLDALDRRREDLRETMLRIAGAIQVLEELFPSSNGNGQPAEALLDAAG